MLCWKPSRFFFEFAKVTFFSRKFRESWISWLPTIGSAKDKHGVRESFAKETCLFAKNRRSRMKDFDQLNIDIDWIDWCCLILINVAWRSLIMGDIDWFWLVLIDWLANWRVDWLLFDCWVVMMMRCWWRGWPWWMMMAMRDDDHGRQDHDDNASILTHKVKVELFVLINSTSCPLSALFGKTCPHDHVCIDGNISSKAR